MSRLPLGALKCPADPPDWWSAVTDTLGSPGGKGELRSVQACGKRKKTEERREDDGNVQMRSPFGLNFFLKK